MTSRTHTTAKCVCRATHAPEPLDPEIHHIDPIGMGGPDTPENEVAVCPTTHTNAHILLRGFVRSARVWTWREATDAYPVPVSRYAYDLAAEGYRRVMARRGVA